MGTFLVQTANLSVDSTDTTRPCLPGFKEIYVRGEIGLHIFWGQRYQKSAACADGLEAEGGIKRVFCEVLHVIWVFHALLRAVFGEFQKKIANFYSVITPWIEVGKTVLMKLLNNFFIKNSCVVCWKWLESLSLRVRHALMCAACGAWAGWRVGRVWDHPKLKRAGRCWFVFFRKQASRMGFFASKWIGVACGWVDFLGELCLIQVRHGLPWCSLKIELCDS